MKVKLLEHVQGVGISGVPLDGDQSVNVLAAGQSYEVDDSLGAWLLEHRKAETEDVMTTNNQATSKRKRNKK